MIWLDYWFVDVLRHTHFFFILVALVGSNAAFGHDAELNCELAESGLKITLPTLGNGDFFLLC